MKRIIYNNKLKKVFISFLTCILIFCYIYPYSVLADASTYSLRGAVEEIYDVIGDNYFFTLRDKVESAVKTKLGDSYQEGDTSSISDGKKAFFYCYDRSDLITVKVTFKTLENAASSRVIDSCEVEISDKFNITTVRNHYDTVEKENRLWFYPTFLGIDVTCIGTYQQWDDVLSEYDEQTMSTGYASAMRNAVDIKLAEETGKADVVAEIGTNNIMITGKVTAGGASFYIEKIEIDSDSLDETSNIANYSYADFKNVFLENTKTEEEIDEELKQKLIASTFKEEYISIGADSFTVDEYAGETIKRYKNELTITVRGSKEAYSILTINLPEDFNKDAIKESVKEDTADLGGILLSPVFYLINFIADAITGLVGELMMPDTSTFSVLQDTAIPVNGEINHTVSTNSFVLGDIKYPNIEYTPEEIFAGKIDLLSIDFISGKNINGEEIKGDWANIRKVISQWYQVLRMIAIIGLLSVLIYTGIKIIISANAKDKAKYKEWIINWFMAVAILFSMHIIMAFIISVTGEFSKLINEACQAINVELSDGATFSTNLMGLVRFMIQSEDFYMKVGYEVMYIALIVYTIKFTLVYLKRVLNMAFLTLIAPIVALTYPIDKLNDGRAQGFDMWIKEYIFNALLQPMHQIMYYILVGSAVSIAASNPIYGIVVLMFMAEAEKLLKKIFGFDKAGGGTVGGMAGAFAAGAIASNLKNIAKLAGGSGGKNGKSNPEKLGEGNAKPTQGLDMDAFTEGALPDGESSDTPEMNNNDEEKTDAQRMFDADEENGEFDDDPAYRDAMAREAQRSENAKEKRKSKFAKGMLNVGKKIAKPVWDFDHGAAYNGKRLLRNVGKAYLGASLGIGAAAVQAGISITDGKYNPAEGLATFAAGYAGGGQLAKGMSKGIESIGNAYREGAYDKEAMMNRAQRKWADREDVIAFNKANYKPEEIKDITRIQSEHLLPYGFNLNEMKSVTKYAQQLQKNNNLSEAAAYKQAANTLKFKQNLEKQHQNNVPYDETKRQEYISTMVKGKSGDEKAKLEKAYQNAFSSLVAFNEANK